MVTWAVCVLGPVGAGATLVALAALLRARLDRHASIPLPRRAVQCLMQSARRLLRTIVPDPVACTAARLYAAHDTWVECHGPPGTCVYGGEEVATWTSLQETSSDLGLMLNCGLDGATTIEMRRYLSELVLRHAPDQVVLSVGAGDWDAAWCPPDVSTTLAHATALVSECYTFGLRDIRLLVAAVPPGRDPDYGEFMTAVADGLQRLDTSCWPGISLHVWDARAATAADVARLGTTAYLADGLRLSLYGQQVMNTFLRVLLRGQP